MKKFFILGLIGFSINGINATPVGDLKNSQWEIVGGSPELQSLANSNMKVAFDDNKANISGGCNTQRGTFSTFWNFLFVRGFASTRMACEQDLMQKDQLSSNFFQGRSHYKIINQNDGTYLNITNSKQQTLNLKAIR